MHQRCIHKMQDIWAQNESLLKAYISRDVDIVLWSKRNLIMPIYFCPLLWNYGRNKMTCIMKATSRKVDIHDVMIRGSTVGAISGTLYNASFQLTISMQISRF